MCVILWMCEIWITQQNALVLAMTKYNRSNSHMITNVHRHRLISWLWSCVNRSRLNWSTYFCAIMKRKKLIQCWNAGKIKILYILIIVHTDFMVRWHYKNGKTIETNKRDLLLWKTVNVCFSWFSIGHRVSWNEKAYT